jgi:WhiB family transcriptional regulator, redox-sensing transcriptional regulator
VSQQTSFHYAAPIIASRIRTNVNTSPSSLRQSRDLRLVSAPQFTSSLDGELNWHVRAACRDISPNEFFPEGKGKKADAAKEICVGCEVRVECLHDAIKNRIKHGIWGGMNEQERRRYARKYRALL